MVPLKCTCHLLLPYLHLVCQDPRAGSPRGVSFDGDWCHDRSSSGGGDLESKEQEQEQEQEQERALPAGHLGDSMSKGELASLIHEGARAIVKSQVRMVLVWCSVVRCGVVWRGVVWRW